ncbi:hypothetical protein ABZX12_06320 [Kribbella sp. NPDC003505]|uniref:hypothetical protein n=1 Tax=Kribbella sp. NPDC003505 TaxID=3154448 RepID=UPI0033B01101
MNQLYAEVVRHHEHLASWLSGEAAPDVLDTFHGAHHPDFVLVAIDGARVDLPALMNALSTSHNAVPGLKIDIEQFEVVTHTPDLAVCRFLERHSVGSLRRVTAVLTGELRWLAVQETPVL